MEHILVLDDEKPVRGLIKDALKHFGYKVMVAGNGEEGLEYFNNSHHFKLVISDIKMPVRMVLNLPDPLEIQTDQKHPS